MEITQNRTSFIVTATTNITAIEDTKKKKTKKKKQKKKNTPP